MNLKILSYNIHKGYDWDKKNYFLEDMKKLIASTQADVVFLQEVVGENQTYRKQGLVDAQFHFLADAEWEHYSYAANLVDKNGDHGNLILSKFLIESKENINISTNRFEKRGFLICKIRLPKVKNSLVIAGCVHLDLLHRGRKKQYDLVKNKILSLNLENYTPTIIAGDFNDWNQKSHDIFEKDLGMLEVFKTEHGDFAKTFPAGFPLLRLDRIYVKNLTVQSARVLLPPVKEGNNNHFSDHLPIFCELQILEDDLDAT
jgi:endonuclease/exonuclease/phosphatase family metal-dependent hydrolase